MFHRDKTCRQLTKAPARGVTNPITEHELADLVHPKPCKVCYSDAPRAKAARRFCPLCNKTQTRPCAHNGGVLVTIAYKTNYVGLLRDPGDEVVTTKYVWPENVHRYEPIAS